MLNVYILKIKGRWSYDQCVEQTIVAKDEERALQIANKEDGIWVIDRQVDLNVEQVLTKDIYEG